jgi:hypothetical protein
MLSCSGPSADQRLMIRINIFCYQNRARRTNKLIPTIGVASRPDGPGSARTDSRFTEGFAARVSSTEINTKRRVETHSTRCVSTTIRRFAGRIHDVAFYFV